MAVAAEARERLAADGASWARLLPDTLCLHEFHQDQVSGALLRGWAHRAGTHRCGTRWGTAGTCSTTRQPQAVLRVPQPPAKGLQFSTLPSVSQVLEVPPGATLLASSERCPVEMYAVGDHVLCIQVRTLV